MAPPTRLDLWSWLALVSTALVSASAEAQQPAPGDDIRLSFEAEAVWLDRSDPGGQTLSGIGDSFDAPENGRKLLSMDDLDFDLELGGRTTLGLHRGRDSLEFVYLRVHQWSDSHAASDPQGRIDSFFANETVNLNLPAGMLNPTNGFRNANWQKLSYGSELDSVELNLRRRLAPTAGLQTSVMAGFRYLRIDEDFDLLSRNDDEPDLGHYDIDTENDLYGLQVGGEAEGGLSRLRLGARIKGGVFASRVQQESRMHVSDSGVVFSQDTDRTGTTFGTLLEAGVELSVVLPFGIRLMTGYDVLRASGLALAPDQIAGKCCFGVMDRLSRDGSVLYHGPRVGLELALGGRPAAVAAGTVPGSPIALEEPDRIDVAGGPDAGDLRFSFRAESVWLQRGDPDGSVLVVADDSGVCAGIYDACALLDVGDLSFHLEGAGRLTMAVESGRNAVEAVYLGLADWSDTQAFSGAFDGDSILEDIEVRLADGSTSNDPFDNAFDGTRASYGSELDSAELNYRRRLAPWAGMEPTLLAGFRYIGIEEAFRFRALEEPSQGDNDGLYAIDADNQLFGLQVGAELTRGFDLGPAVLRVGVRAKGGLLANRAEQDTNISVRPNEIVDADGADVELANVVEAGLMLELELPFGLSLVGGYDAMRIGGLALAPDQISPIFARGGFDRIDTEGSVFYHGPWVGAQIAFDVGNPFD